MTARASTVDVVPFVDEGLGNSSYLLDIGDGEALVVDPIRVAGQSERTRRDGTRIAFTADTHTHADYVSGSPRLASNGATFLAPKAARLECEQIEVGRFVLRALPTPGHTPDHLAYLMLEHGAPVALFSGGSLMVATAGRTDLLGPQHTDALARAQFHSLRALLALPDDLPVYPTHGAGSFCAVPGAADRTTTIGRERATNPLLQIDDEDEFVERLVAGFGTLPPYFLRLPEVNRRGALLQAREELPPLGVAQAQRLVADGATVVDVRPIDAFAAGHVPGALSNALRPVFGAWLAWLVPPDDPIVFVTGPNTDVTELLRQAANVGSDNVAGVLDGGMDAWRIAGLDVEALELVDAHASRGTIIDVRQREEFAIGHVPGARNIELGDVTDVQLGDGPLTTMCAHGERAATAASRLQRAGHRDVRVFVGGPADWSAATGIALQTDQ
jgi:hydroxyacylglutathione hydrolase